MRLGFTHWDFTFHRYLTHLIHSIHSKWCIMPSNKSIAMIKVYKIKIICHTNTYQELTLSTNKWYVPYFMVVQMTWVWTFFNNNSNHPRMLRVEHSLSLWWRWRTQSTIYIYIYKYIYIYIYIIKYVYIRGLAVLCYVTFTLINIKIIYIYIIKYVYIRGLAVLCYVTFTWINIKAFTAHGYHILQDCFELASLWNHRFSVVSHCALI